MVSYYRDQGRSRKDHKVLLYKDLIGTIVSLLQNELSIVVCSKSDYPGLERTLESLNALVEDPPQIILILSGYLESEIEKIHNEFSNLKIELLDVAPQGIYHAQNLGLSKVKKRFVLFLNGGDKLESSSGLKHLVGKLGESTWGYGEIDLVDDNLKNRKRYRFKYSKYLHRLGLKYVPHPATVINAEEAIKLGGFDEKYSSAADHKLLLMFSKSSRPVVVSRQISTFYRGGMSTRNQRDVVTDCKNISHELFGYYFKNKSLDSLIWCFLFVARRILKA
jgi:hypothetical protein